MINLAPSRSELSILAHEPRWISEETKLYALFLCGGNFLGESGHFCAGSAINYGDGIADTQPSGYAGRVYRGIAAANDAHAPSDLWFLLEVDSFQELERVNHAIGILIGYTQRA